MAPSQVISHGDHPATPDVAPQYTSTEGLLIAASARTINIVEIREMIMMYLDPLSMSNLISVHSGALATFQKYAVEFLNASIYQIPSQIFAVTILVALEQKPKDVPLWPEIPPWDSLSPEELDALEERYRENALKRDYYDRAWCGVPNTELEKFLNDEVQYNAWTLEDVKNPVKSLKQLALMYDAVETLASSRIWNHVDDPELGAGLEPNNRWDAEIDEIRTVLWIYQLYCVLFRETGTTESGEALFPSKHVQEVFLWNIEKDATDGNDVMCRLYGVYDDLSSFLGELYEQNYARCFAEAYKNRPEQKEEQEEADRKPWWKMPPRPPPSVVCDTRHNFHGFVEYQMSLGLPFLVDIYRRSLETTRWQDLPAQKLWTQSFFSRARNRCTYWDTDGGFELTPVEEGTKGYRLELVVPSGSGDYKLEFLDPVFTEPDFKPTDMGDLSDWRQNGKVNRFVVRSIEGRHEKGAGIRVNS